MTVVRATLAIATFLAFGACASAPPNLNDDMIIPGERSVMSNWACRWPNCSP